MKEITAYHFSNGKLANGDDRNVVEGLALACRADEIKLCQHGFHASLKPLDALEYAPGSILSVVKCGGKIIYGNDKIVCSQRRHIKVIDCEILLHHFAIWCAEQALELIDTPDPSSLKVIAVKKLWLAGQASNEDLDTATRDARAAARDAAWAAARAATWAAARDAAWAAARAAQNTQLELMINKAISNSVGMTI